MSNLVIVAIPSEDDPVWRVSTEKKPHLTLLFLGDANNPKRGEIAQFLLHAVNVGLYRFTLDVDRRGVLGSDNADVVFFEEDSWDLPELKNFRSSLLKDNNIRAAYDSTEQFPEWQPHLTLGYPTAPAKDNAVDYPIQYVRFDRIALWDGDYEGVELVLKRYPYPMEVSMSSMNDARTSAGLKVVEEVLSHHGVKGMRWGVRKERAASDVSVSTNAAKTKTKQKIKTSGGDHHDAHPDAINAAVSKQKIKKSGPAALSNDELRSLATRMQLEQQVSDLSSRQTGEGKKFVKDLLVNTGKQQAQRIANQKATEAVDKTVLKNKGKK